MKKTGVIEEIDGNGMVSFRDGSRYGTSDKVKNFIGKFRAGDEVEVNVGSDDVILYIGKAGQGTPQRSSAPAFARGMPGTTVPAPAAKPASPAPAYEKKGDWPTKEERDAQGKRIGRQACLNTAVEICKLQMGSAVGDAELSKKLRGVDYEAVVLACAERLETWVART